MPRIGRHPLKEKKIKETISQPNDITITTIVYIPSLDGYWKNSFDVLKLFFQSLKENTSQSYDLMVLDNGSCKKIIDYLIRLRNDGIIQYLILSYKNLKKLGALNYLLRSAPGEIISYADSDVFFLEGWLDESLKIISTYPEAAKVTAIPIVGGDTTKISNTFYLAALEDRSINVSTGILVKDDYVKAHATSIGKSINNFVPSDRIDTLLERENVRAFLSTADFQFTIVKSALSKILPLELTNEEDYYDPIYSPILENKLDEEGWWQLSSSKYLIHHMGNTVPDFNKELPWIDNSSVFTMQKKKEILEQEKNQSNIIKSTRIRKILKKINLWSYRKLYEK